MNRSEGKVIIRREDTVELIEILKEKKKEALEIADSTVSRPVLMKYSKKQKVQRKNMESI